MNKLLRVVAACLLMGTFSTAFAQTPVIACKTKKCPEGLHWDAAQCKCVEVSVVPGTECLQEDCPSGQHWDKAQCKCVDNNAAGETTSKCLERVCLKGQHWDDTQCACVEDTVVETDVIANLPTLENFTLVESYGSADDIFLVFSPKGIENVLLVIHLYNENGLDILQTWCEGDEKICKAMGNGKDCTENDTNTWCYLKEEAPSGGKEGK